MLEVSLQIQVRGQAVSQPPATGRPMTWRTICPAPSGLGESLAGRDVLVHCSLSTPVAGRAQCTLTRSPIGQCLLQHIAAAGFQVKQAMCQEAGAAWQGRVLEDA